MVTLKLMSSDEFQNYMTMAIDNYANDKVLSGNWNKEESMNRAREEYSKLLPKDEKTESNFLYTVLHDNQTIGMIWLAQKSIEEGFIYDINIFDEYQGHGYGKETMKKIEEIAKNLGMKKIGLHVFGHNQVARGLYEKLGYQTTNVMMVKQI